MSRDRLEAAWRVAQGRCDRSAAPTAAMERDAELAWEAVSDFCDEHLECKSVGCRIVSPDYAFCPAHRV